MKAAFTSFIVLASCLSNVPAAFSQGQTALAADFEREGAAVRDECFKHPQVGCAATLLTDHPVHLAVGTIAPGNGVAFGPAFVWHKTPSETWRLTGSADAVRALGGAWRAGAYTNIIRTALDDQHSRACERLVPGRDVFPVVALYAQSTSLPQVSYFGIGPDTTANQKTFFGLRETTIGARGVCLLPADSVWGRLRVSLTGEANGRFVAIRPGPSGSVPSLDQRYTDATAPGLSGQPNVVQFGEGIRLTPSISNGRVNLNYLVSYEQFRAGGTSDFQRWSVDLRHEIPIFGTSVPTAKDTNDPNACAIGPTTPTLCPPITSRNLSGSLTLRGFLSKSVVSGANAVPFYFQHTLGGSDLDGERILASYDDYRFRGPHLVLFQEWFEHALVRRFPIGIVIAADQGKVFGQNDPVDFHGFRHTIAVGASLRAGGLPMALLTYATGGPEGHHVAITVSPTLLGGSSRPSLQ